MKPAKHPRIPVLPYINSLLGARLDGIHEETSGGRHDFVVDYQEFYPSEPALIGSENGRLFEHVKGSYLPRRLRFTGVRAIQCEGLYTHPESLPLDHPARDLRGILCWIPFNDTNLFTIFTHGSDDPARLWVTSRGCVQEHGEGDPEPVEITRNWSPPPPFRPGLIPYLKQSRKRYGGEPVTVQVGGRRFHRRLFVGDIESQSEQRPLVDAVLNVGEEPSRWLKNGACEPPDRWVIRGEGDKGMDVQQMTEEAAWVIERLRKGQRVLIHCVAGLNRSTSVACAVLILLEGLSAQAALDRVRERHAWARPDENHWLVLQWMAKEGG